MGLLVDPGSPQTDRVIETMQAASRAKGIQLRILKAGTESEIGTAFDSLVQQPVDALVVQADPLSTVANSSQH
jgi:putative tryptophan/tyrosine transport system substrate-binding protein